MVTIESTPEFASKVYETMNRNYEVVRQRLGRPMSLTEKVLLSHLDDPANQELEAGVSYLQLRPDRVILQDVLGQTAMLQFMQTRKDKVEVSTSVHCDHLIQARVEVFPTSANRWPKTMKSTISLRTPPPNTASDSGVPARGLFIK